MASQLVTQVHNPDEDNDNALEIDNNVYIDDSEDKKEPAVSCWSAMWQSCVNCLTCSSSSSSVEDTETTHVYTPEGGKLPRGKYLLPQPSTNHRGKKCLVLDLDETLVHSSFKPVPNADFVISIELENEIHHVYVLKRPGVDEFLRHVGKKFEVVIFTASLAKYADPLLDMLDPSGICSYRLFREACVQHYGNYVKDLSLLGRPLEHSIIIDNSPFSYIFQPDNAIAISSWFNDQNDHQLFQILPLLDQIAEADDIRTVLASRAEDDPLHQLQPST